jgi:hypothetical protein
MDIMEARDFHVPFLVCSEYGRTVLAAAHVTRPNPPDQTATEARARDRQRAVWPAGPLQVVVARLQPLRR